MENPKNKEKVTDAIVEMTGEGEGAMEKAMDDAARIVREKNIAYPALVIPWGENSGADFHAVSNEDELKDAVKSAMNASIHKKRVHIISVYGKERREQYKAGLYPGEGNIK